MSKQEFLMELRKGLFGLPQEEIEERLLFYSEMIEDRMEEGLTEEDAVLEIGTIEDVVSQIIADIPLSKIVKERVKPKRRLRVVEIVLLVLGSPIWLSLFIALFIVLFALYIVVWSVLLSLWLSETSLIICSLSGVISAVALVFQGKGINGIAMLGVGIFCAGLSIFLFFGCKEVTKGSLHLTKRIVLAIKSLFIGKENVK